jgi:hypothetical protein
MSTQIAASIPVEQFRAALLTVLNEAFDPVDGPTYFLDKGDSFFETLSGISAEQASQSLGPRSATLAAKVNHTRFYLDAVIANAEAGAYVPVDWDSSWAVGDVDEAGWQDLVERLRATSERFRQMAATNEVWNEQIVGGAFGVVAHTAYHLGEIRQALAAIAPAGD